MRTKALIAAAVLLAVLTAAVMIPKGKRPYRELNASDIVSAAVYLGPPDRTVRIADLEELASYLNDIVIYNEDNGYTDYCGQTVRFTLTMADGFQVELTAFSPFVIINGTGYRAEYEPCERLSRYANQLLNAK